MRDGRRTIIEYHIVFMLYSNSKKIIVVGIKYKLLKIVIRKGTYNTIGEYVALDFNVILISYLSYSDIIYIIIMYDDYNII